MRVLRSFSAVAAIALMAACDLSTEPNVPDPIDPANDFYAPSLGITIATMTKLPNGVYIKDKVVGAGAAAAANDSVQVNYSGWLPNGTLFDTSKQTTRKPLEFVIGRNVYIGAFENAAIGMQPGGVRTVIIPTALAYGQQGRPEAGIPANSNLVFQLEYIGRL
jgi:FKBP-type peptidyl-prolyl cis-trans isomerase FkpA